MKNKILRKVICSFALALILAAVFSVSAFATPDTLPADIASTNESLITVRAPETTTISTTNSKLAISAVAAPGTVVTVYRYDVATNLFYKVMLEDEPLESVVGSSWLFASQVDLQTGLNQFIVRGAIDDENFTISRFDVNLLNEGFMDRIKGVISVIFN
ncbi:MAG: hypothetical protein IKW59_04915 [Clostridia bacterium]|nr:hypothetical protein [Clostridia bacterium]